MVIERGAGEAVHYQDSDFSGRVPWWWTAPTRCTKADLMLKVAPPSHREIEMLRPKQILFSALQLNVQPKDTLRRMMEKKMHRRGVGLHQGPRGHLSDHPGHGRMAGTPPS